MDKILYKCDICGEIFLTGNEFVVHRMTHTGAEQYKCKVCGQSFWDLVALLCHERTHEKAYKCTTCGKSFSMAASLICHTRIHTGERPYVCDICQKTFTQAGHLQRHKRIHSGVKPYVCDICQNAFVDLSTLIRHRRTHTGEKPYHCDICNKSFTQSTNFVFHKRIHSGERPYVCDLCDKTFIRSCDLLCHKRTHTGEKPYTCETCNKSFSKSSSLVDHERTHTGQKPYICDTCGKAFATSSHLSTHKRIHTGEKPYKCDVCQKQFTTSSGLVCHKRIHTGDKPYQCDLCEKRFCQLSHLLSHKRRHHGIQPYVCEICDQGFTVASNLLSHQQIHSEEIPYLCNVCGIAFNDSSTLVRHKQSHTGEQLGRHNSFVRPSDSIIYQISSTKGAKYQNMPSGSDIGTPSMLKTQIRDKYVKFEKTDHAQPCSINSHLLEPAERSSFKDEENIECVDKTLVCPKCSSSFQSQIKLKAHNCSRFVKAALPFSPLEQKVFELIQKSTARFESEVDIKQNVPDSEDNILCTKSNEPTGLFSDNSPQCKVETQEYTPFHENGNRSNPIQELKTSQEYSHITYVCSQCNSCFNSISLLEKHDCVQMNICKKESDESNVYKECMYVKEKQCLPRIEKIVGDDASIACVCSQCGGVFQSSSQLDEHVLRAHGLMPVL